MSALTSPNFIMMQVNSIDNDTNTTIHTNMNFNVNVVNIGFLDDSNTILHSGSVQNVQNNEVITCTDKDYLSVVKKIKKDNITPDNIGEIMLCQIPGISSVTSVAIMSKFKTLPNLISQIQENENCLKDISYTNSKNQVRKINKTCLVNLVKFLLNK